MCILFINLSFFFSKIVVMKRKQIQDNANTKKQCMNNIFENYQLVYVVILNMIPFLNIWAIHRISLVSKTCRAVVKALVSEVAFWHGSMSTWLKYVDDDTASRRVNLKSCHRDYIFTHELALWKSGYYKTITTFLDVKKNMRCGEFVSQLSFIDGDNRPVDDTFKLCIARFSLCADIESRILNTFIKPQMCGYTYGFNEKIQYIIKNYCTIDSSWYRYSKNNIRLFYYLLELRENLPLLISENKYMCSRLLLIYEQYEFDIVEYVDSDTLWQVLDTYDLFYRLLKASSNPTHLIESYAKTGKGKDMAYFVKYRKLMIRYVPEDKLKRMFNIGPYYSPRWDYEIDAISTDNIDYIDALYKRRLHDHCYDDAIIHVQSLDMFKRIWEKYQIDKCKFIQSIDDYIIPYNYSLMKQVLEFIQPESFEPFYKLKKIINAQLAWAFVDYEFDRGIPSPETICYLYLYTGVIGFPFPIPDKQTSFNHYLSAGQYMNARVLYEPHFKYALRDIQLVGDKINDGIDLISRVTKIHRNCPSVFRLLTMLHLIEDWKSLMDTVITKFPHVFTIMKTVNVNLEGYVTFIMEHINNDRMRLKYFKEIESGICCDDSKEIYRLSIRYNFPFVNEHREIFY